MKQNFTLSSCKFRTALLTTALCAMSVASFAQKPTLIYTTESEKWVEAKKAIKPSSADEQNLDIVVYNETLQTIDGVGGTFNEIGWDALQTLPEAKVQEVMEALFSEEGCNFSIARIPVGSSDYALSYYSCCEVDEDFGMRDFTIDRDRYILIPYIKAAKTFRPDLQVWASPWSPPSWMKINKHYSTRGGDWNGRTNGNRMPEGADVFNNATAFNMQERYLQAYALYFSKFAQAYKNEGVELFAIMPQNEIAYSPNWPSCTWRAEDMAYFIGKFMGPQFEKDNVDTKIWLGTINWSRPEYCRLILDDKEASKYIAGVGFQWAGERALPTISKEYPNIKFMQSENKCGEHENNWTSLENSWKSVVHYMSNGCNMYTYWNMVLDETGSSAWGWPQNSMVVVDRDTQEVKYTEEFYLFKHFSHFVQPGSQMLKVSEGKNHIAFKMTDGRTVLMVYNPEEAAKSYNIKVGDDTIAVELKAKSITSIVL